MNVLSASSRDKKPRCGVVSRKIHFQAFTQGQMSMVPKKYAFLGELKKVRLGELFEYG